MGLEPTTPACKAGSGRRPTCTSTLNVQVSGCLRRPSQPFDDRPCPPWWARGGHGQSPSQHTPRQSRAVRVGSRTSVTLAIRSRAFIGCSQITPILVKALQGVQRECWFRSSSLLWSSRWSRTGWHSSVTTTASHLVRRATSDSRYRRSPRSDRVTTTPAAGLCRRRSCHRSTVPRCTRRCRSRDRPLSTATSPRRAQARDGRGASSPARRRL